MRELTIPFEMGRVIKYKRRRTKDNTITAPNWFIRHVLIFRGLALKHTP